MIGACEGEDRESDTDHDRCRDLGRVVGDEARDGHGGHADIVHAGHGQAEQAAGEAGPERFGDRTLPGPEGGKAAGRCDERRQGR